MKRRANIRSAGAKCRASRDPASGFGLLGALVALAIAGFLMVAVMRLSDTTTQSARSNELKDELTALKVILQKSVDCDATLAAVPPAGISPLNPDPALCGSSSAPGGQVAPFLRLHRLSHAATPKYMTGPLNAGGYAALGDWVIRASCSGAERSLVVRAARLQKGTANFAKHPTTGEVLDWDAKESLLFGDPSGGWPLCFTPKLRAESYSLKTTRKDSLTGTNLYPRMHSLQGVLEDLYGFSCGVNGCFTNGTFDIAGGEPPPSSVKRLGPLFFQATSTCNRYCKRRSHAGGAVTESGTPTGSSLDYDDAVVVCTCVGR